MMASLSSSISNGGTAPCRFIRVAGCTRGSGQAENRSYGFPGRLETPGGTWRHGIPWTRVPAADPSDARALANWCWLVAPSPGLRSRLKGTIATAIASADEQGSSGEDQRLVPGPPLPR